jgi:anti-sigma B factor antagonist
MSNSFVVIDGPTRGNAAVVLVQGRVDAKTAPQMVEQCLAARPARGHLVLDLSGVTFLSSSGVGALMVIAEKVKVDGGTLRIASPSPFVRTPLELLNLNRFLSIDGSVDDSIASIGG